jgi:hypothetical protein
VSFVVISTESGTGTVVVEPGVTVNVSLNAVPGTETLPLAGAIPVRFRTNCGVVAPGSNAGSPSQKSVPLLEAARADTAASRAHVTTPIVAQPRTTRQFNQTPAGLDSVSDRLTPDPAAATVLKR